LDAHGAARWKWAGALAGFVLLAGLESMRLGLDGNWDLKNYHFYNAYAWLNARLAWDVAPAMVQTYHNPLLDLPFYAMVRAGLPPEAISFLMAIPAGIAAFFLLRLAAVLFPRGIENRNLWIGLAVAIGITGAAGHAVIGSTMNEWPPAALLAAAISVLASAAARSGGPRWGAITTAGALTGLAVGAKLTYGIFAPALVVAMMSFGSPRERFARGAVLGAMIAAGFLAAYAFWGAALYREFGSPFFPYFNDLFKSPYWLPEAFFDRSFGPRNWKQWIFFPFYFSWVSWMVGEIPFRDFRFPILYALAALALAKYALNRRRAPADGRDPRDNAWRFVAVFTFAAYLAWLKVFGIFRYLVPLEMLTGPLIVGCTLYLVPAAATRRRALAILAAAIIVSTHAGNWGRLEYPDRYFEVAVPELAPGALVIVSVRHPLAYVIPFSRPDARFVSPSNNFLHLGQDNLLTRRIAQLIATHAGPMYSLDFVDQEDTAAALDYYQLVLDPSSCQGIRSNLDSNAMRFCRVERKR
jgi:hypothetical protein